MKYGYARVSTMGQNLDTQIEQLKQADCDKIYSENSQGRQLIGLNLSCF